MPAEEGKLDGVTDERQSVTFDANETSHCCNGCGQGASVDVKICSGCRAVKYCDGRCQRKHWKSHKVLCQAIKFLSKQEDERCRNNCTFASHLNPEQHKQLISLVGPRCVVECGIGGQQTKALWDTGAQVSLVSLSWLQDNGIDAEVKDIKEIIDNLIDVEGVGEHSNHIWNINALPFKLEIPLKLKVHLWLQKRC